MYKEVGRISGSGEFREVRRSTDQNILSTCTKLQRKQRNKKIQSANSRFGYVNKTKQTLGLQFSLVLKVKPERC